MKRILSIILLGYFVISLFSTELSYNLGIVCKNDHNLLLKSAVMRDDNIEFFLSYKNNSPRNKSIGIFSPTTNKSIFLYNADGSKIYKLIDLKKIPKWWPTKKYVLKSGEEFNFSLIFEPPEPTIQLNIVEGKNNFNSKTGWNFINIDVNTYSFINKKVIEILDKINPSDKDKEFLEEYKKFDYIQDFISYYKNKTSEMKNNFISKWKNDLRAAYFIDYFLKKEYDSIILNPDIEKAYSIISEYPNTLTSKKLKKFITPILIKQIRNDYTPLTNSQSLEKLALFIKKYSKFEKYFPDLKTLDEAKQKIRNLILQKREELKKQKNPKLYVDFFKKFGKSSFKNTIYADYKKLEEEKFNEAIILNNPNAFENFLQYFPNSKHVNEIHKKYFDYFKNNNVTIEEITNYVGKYPDSPYIQDILKIIPEKSVQDTTKKVVKRKYNSIEDKINAFKEGIKVGDVLHYKEKTSISVDNTDNDSSYEIIYTAKILRILKTKIRVKIIDASLNIENPSTAILESFKDIKDVMIDTIEDKKITKFEEFKDF